MDTGNPPGAEGRPSPGTRIPPGLGLERIGLVCLASPRLTLLVLTLMVGLGVFGVSRLGFDNDLRNLYRTDSPQSRLLDAMVARFPVLRNQIVLLVEGEDLPTREGMETLRSVHLDLRFVEGIAGSVSVFSARRPPAGEQPPGPLFPADLPRGEALQGLIAEAQEHPLLGGKLLSDDARAALIMLFIDGEASSARVAQDVQGSVRDSLAFANPAGLEVTATGNPILRQEILAGIKRDQVVLNLLGILAALALCGVYFRNLRLVVVTALPGVVGVAWTLGTFGLIGHPLNAMTNVLPTLVLVIAFADSLHMVHAVRTRLGQGAPPRDAARHAVVAVGPACAMTSITTMVVFLSLALSDSPTIRDFGYAGAWAAFMAFAAVVTVVPTLAALGLRAAEGVAGGHGGTGPARVIARIAAAAAALAVGRPRTVAACGAVVFGLAAAGYAAVETRYSYRDFLPDGSLSAGAIDRIDESLGGADTVNVMIRRQAETAATPPGEVVRAVHETVDNMEEFASVFSLKSIEDWLGRRLDADAAVDIGETFALPDHLAGQLGSATGDAWLVTAYMHEMDSSLSAPLLDRLDRALDRVRAAAPAYRIDITGLVPMTDRSSNELIRSLNFSLVAAIAVTVGFMAFTFGSIVVGVLAAVPNFLPLAAAGSFLYLTGDGLQITSVVALTVAFGIAVDDTIHLLHRWHKEPPGSAAERLGGALRQVGPVLIATTIVLAAGFSTTVASTMQIVRAFGTICVLTISVALLADLLLMPALLMLAEPLMKRKRNRS